MTCWEGLEVQAFRYGLEFVISNPQVAFCIGKTFVIKLVHDQRQVHTLHASMVSPGFSQTVRAEVAAQAHLLTDGSDDFPGLATPD